MTGYVRLKSRCSICGTSLKKRSKLFHLFYVCGIVPQSCISRLLRGLLGRVNEDEIEAQTDALRKKLLAGSVNGEKSTVKGQLKPHQVHELAAAKIEESEKLRKALGIRDDYEEGSHWKRQEERLRDGIGER